MPKRSVTLMTTDRSDMSSAGELSLMMVFCYWFSVPKWRKQFCLLSLIRSVHEHVHSPPSWPQIASCQGCLPSLRRQRLWIPV